MFVQKKLQAGARSSEIARTLGKSRGYLTFIGALIDPPAWLLDLYRKYGTLLLMCWCAPRRCHGETIQKELVRMLEEGYEGHSQTAKARRREGTVTG